MQKMTVEQATEQAQRVIRGEAQLTQEQEQLALDLAEPIFGAAGELLKVGGYPPPAGDAGLVLRHLLKGMLLAAIIQGHDRESLLKLAPHFAADAIGRVFGKSPAVQT